MIGVEEAIRLITENARRLESETVTLAAAAGRWTSKPVVARTTNLPFRASAMDGYAVRFADAAGDARLKVTGVAAAGAPFSGEVTKGEAVRIFTGAAVPTGADHVVIQEDVTRDGDEITVREEQAEPGNIRPPGEDFREGETIVPAGTRLSPISVALAASANYREIDVSRRPRVFFFGNGDELIAPGGGEIAPGQIISSTPFGFMPLIEEFGAEAFDGGIARDTIESIGDAIERAAAGRADIIVPLGGASVGDYDLVKPAFKERGFELLFEKVAVKPGKPAWLARRGGTYALGLPGNPASSFACAHLFLAPLIRNLSGAADPSPAPIVARLAQPLAKNGVRAHYLRAEYRVDNEGRLVARAFANQDSALLSPFAAANCLIVRPPNAPAAGVGDMVDLIAFAAPAPLASKRRG
jgi:molybdopterin molybdotransferase